MNQQETASTIRRKEEKMQNEELSCLAKKVRTSLPNVESFPIATIYTTIKDQEKTKLNLSDFKELIYHLTGWDISFQVIRRQLEINQIVL
jgi:hemolysin activation/secretion protein